MTTAVAQQSSDLPEPEHPASPGGWLAIYKHDLDSRRPAPAPADDGRADLERRTQQWIDEIRPRDAIERDLAERAAHLSWALERARKADDAAAARAVDEARRKALDRAEILGRRLLGELSAPTKSRGAASDLAGVLVRRLESFAEGCQWLIDRWTGMAAMVASRRRPGPSDLHRMIRLMGKEPLDAPYDDEVSALLAALDADSPGAADDFLTLCRERTPAGDPAFREHRDWRPLGPAVEPGHGIGGDILALARRQSRRLEILRNRQLAEPVVADDPDQERRQRHQLALSRELRQVVEQIRKLKKEPAAREEPRAEASAPARPASPPRSRVRIVRRKPAPAPSVPSTPGLAAESPPRRKPRRLVLRC